MKKIYSLVTLMTMSLAATATEASAQDYAEQLMIETYETVSTPVGTPVAIEAIMAYGTAPYTVQWLSPQNTVLGEQHLDDLPMDVLSYNVTPTECGDYIVRVTDATNTVATDTVRVITTGDAVAATFENLYLDRESYNNGASADGSDRFSSFANGSFSFSTSNQYGGSYWYGFAYSNSTSASGESLEEQYNSVTGGGYGGSGNFAVCYVDSWGVPPTITTLGTDMGTALKGCYITNSAYAYSVMTTGNAFARALVPGDWFKVTFTADNGKAVDYYLADLRSEDASQHYILNQWDWVDLSPLGLVKSITISMSGSDVGDWGLNTPTYLCIDNFNDTNPSTPVHQTHVSGNRNGGQTQYYDVNGTRHSHIQKGLNIVRTSDGKVVKVLR